MTGEREKELVPAWLGASAPCRRATEAAGTKHSRELSRGGPFWPAWVGNQGRPREEVARRRKGTPNLGTERAKASVRREAWEAGPTDPPDLRPAPGKGAQAPGEAGVSGTLPLRREERKGGGALISLTPLMSS